MPKCIAIGDPHFQVNNVAETIEFIKKIKLLVKQLSPDFVVVLGDLLHTHEKIHTVPFNLATKFLISLSKVVKVYLLIGNHDYCNNQQFLTENHPFNSFKKINNIVICDKVICDTIDGCKFVFTPYVPPDRFEEALTTLEETGETWIDANCIFAHQEFYGCRFNPTTCSTNGDIWPEEYPMVISGHIHDQQWLQKNIYYVGSSMQHSYGESGNKTIVMLEFPKFKLIKIDLEMRKKRIIYVKIEDIKKINVDEKRTSTKLVITGTPEQIKTFRKTGEYKNLSRNDNIMISFLPKSNEKQCNIIHGDTINNTKKSIFEIMETLVDKNNKYLMDAFEELKNQN